MEANPRKVEGASSSLFIFAPWERKKRQGQADEISWILGDIVHVTVVLSNPMAFPVSIRHLSLRFPK